ncbi:MAG: PDZ domain-containing protein [Actinomycetota bacterium]|nr:PDZ domain-containing protein [Actinomycetota bacterium]
MRKSGSQLTGSLLVVLVLAAACGADGPDTVAESDLSSAESKDLEFATQPFDSEVDLGELIDDSVVGGLVFLRDQQLFSMSLEPTFRPLLGVYAEQLFPAAVEKWSHADLLELNVYDGVDKGLVVLDLVEGGAAESVGLKPGEVIIRFDGQIVETTETLRGAVENAGIGRVVNVVVVGHDGSIRKVRVTIGALEAYDDHRLMFWPDNRHHVEWSPDRTRLLFVNIPWRQQKQLYVQQLYVQNGDGSDLTQVALGDRFWNPIWSKDGKEIYFMGDDDDLYVIDADGSNRRRLSGASPGQFEGVSIGSWSPDRSQIVVVYRGLWEAIYLMDSDGLNERRLAGFDDHGIRFLLDVVWSDDGSELLFWGHQEGGPHSKGSVIFRVDSDGSNLRQLTTRQDDDHFDVMAKWSPDGSKILFQSNRDQGCGADVMAAYSHCDQYESYLMNADGSEAVRIDAEIQGDLFWSPDGQQFAFSASDGGECCVIYVADRDGTNLLDLGMSGRIMGWLDN